MWIKDFCAARDTERKVFLNGQMLLTEEQLLCHFTRK